MSSEVNVDYFQMLPIELWKQLKYSSDLFSNCKAVSKAFHRMLSEQPEVDGVIYVGILPCRSFECFFRTNADTLVIRNYPTVLTAPHPSYIKAVQDIGSVHHKLSTTEFISKLEIDGTCPPDLVYLIMAQHGHRLTKIKLPMFSFDLIREILKACSEYRIMNPKRGLLRNMVELDFPVSGFPHVRGALDTEWVSFFAELSGLRILNCSPTFAIRLASTDSINMPNLTVISVNGDYPVSVSSTDSAIVSFHPSAVPALRSVWIIPDSPRVEYVAHMLCAKVSHQIRHLYLGKSRSRIPTWLHLAFPNVATVTLDSDGDFDSSQFLSDSRCRSFDVIVPWRLLFKNYKNWWWEGNYDALVAKINKLCPEANLFVQVDRDFYESHELRTLYSAVTPTKTRRYQLKVPDEDAGISLKLEAAFDLMKRLLDKRPPILREIQFV